MCPNVNEDTQLRIGDVRIRIRRMGARMRMMGALTFLFSPEECRVCSRTVGGVVF